MAIEPVGNKMSIENIDPMKRSIAENARESAKKSINKEKNQSTLKQIQEKNKGFYIDRKA